MLPGPRSFSGHGVPIQEKWYATYGKSLKHVRIVQGIGGTFDTIAGKVKRAPENLEKDSAEWLYRLITEPKRLRRAKVLPLFSLKVLGIEYEPSVAG